MHMIQQSGKTQSLNADRRAADMIRPSLDDAVI